MAAPSRVRDAVEGGFDIGGMHVKVTAEKDPAKLPLKDLGVSIVLECTGPLH